MDFSTDGPHGDLAIAGGVGAEHDCATFGFEVNRHPGGSMISVTSWAINYQCALCDEAWTVYRDGEPYGVIETDRHGLRNYRHTHPEHWPCEACATVAAWAAEDQAQVEEWERVQAYADEHGCASCGAKVDVMVAGRDGLVCEPCGEAEDACEECDGTGHYDGGSMCEGCYGSGQGPEDDDW